MSRRRVLAAGFKHHGSETLSETELVAAIALERGWYAPDEVRRLIDSALAAGELEGDAQGLNPTFDIGEITIPSGYEPPADLTEEATPFEQVISRLESAGFDKRDAVASINRLQTNTGLTSDAAALVYAHSEGIDVRSDAERIANELAVTDR